jgi:hypothetical protein
MVYWIYVHVASVHTGVSTEMSGFRYRGYWQYWRSVRPTEIECCTKVMAPLLRFILEIQRKWRCRYSGYWQYWRSRRPTEIEYGSYCSLNGNVSLQIQWILIILTFNKAHWNRMLYWRDGHVTTVHIGDSAKMCVYRYSWYWQYWHSIRTSELEYCIKYMATLLLFILEFQRKYQIQWKLTMLTFNKALLIRLLYWIYAHVVTVHIGVYTEMSWFRYSWYCQY